jgi:hypothetical protein
MNIFYKSKFRVIAENGNHIDFYLKGKGTFYEEDI